MLDLSEIVSTKRLRLAGHVLRLSEDRPASVAMNYVPEAERRRRRRPQMTWRIRFVKIKKKERK